jgi:hypothetical protein
MAVTAYAGALATVSALNERLDITSPTQDDFLQTLINAASRKIESYTNRLLKARAYTDALFNGNGRQFFESDPLRDGMGGSLASGDTLSQRAFGRRLETPINSVTSITLDDTVQTVGNDPDLYDVQVVALGRPSGLGDGLYRAGGWTTGINNLKTTYNGGFSPLPEDLTEACIVTVMAWFMDKDRKYIRLIAASAQGEYIGLDKSALPQVVREILTSFVRPVVLGI